MEITVLERIVPALQAAGGAGGIFLNSIEPDTGKPNTMTIGWGQTGVMWRVPVFVAAVRLSRYTYQLVKKTGEFTVSMPHSGELKKALALCGAKSGRDIDKIEAAGLKMVPSKSLKTPILDGCALTIECKVLGAFDMNFDALDPQVKSHYYADNDLHELFFGEIVECY